MTDQQHAAGVVAQRLRQRRFALHIKMVGGFIQQQQAVARQRQADEQQPRPLAAAEGADLLAMPRPAKSGGDQRPFRASADGANGVRASSRLASSGNCASVWS
jgi:hypothetical protein